ncbi:uncharacterized protein LOC141705510 [Apium graveolens]|uniref:uncharacterized protein LOC141705510 n=1 Tax=Apium graveolens TaxID=4045 RepID=UPI003D7B0E4D
MSFTAGDEFDYPAGGSEEFGDEDDDEEDFMHTGGEAETGKNSRFGPPHLAVNQYGFLTPIGSTPNIIRIFSTMQVGDPSTKVAVHCLLESGLFPLCLKSIEYGNELSQSTASWIMSRITMQEQGLQYCCEPANRLCAIMKVFNDVIEKMQDEPSTTVLKNIIQCYVILSDDPSRGCLLLRSFIPPILTTAPYIEALRARPITLKKLQDLFQKLSMGCGPNAEAVGDVAGSSHLDR